LNSTDANMLPRRTQVRTSSNPAFRNLPGGQGGGYATFDRYGGAAAYGDAQAAQVGYGRAGVGERPLTVDDVVTKTGISAGTALVVGALTAVTGMYGLAIVGFIVGFIVSLALIFKPNWANAGTVLLYSAAMGAALGGITGLLEFSGTQFQGIGLQAVIGTAGVFVGMLVVYKTGAVRVTPKFTKWMIGALIGVTVLMLFNLIFAFFIPGGLGLREPTPLGYLFSIVVIGVAAFSLLLDFDMADQAVRGGAPAKFAWYIAFGLMVTLVWLYIEILRLLSYLRQE
jgi:uncharacterized YccA/Bax inhibitor family protein